MLKRLPCFKEHFALREYEDVKVEVSNSMEEGFSTVHEDSVRSPDSL